MASSSSSRPQGNLMSKGTDSLPHPQRGGWDVFLSHSGEQKPFVKGLYKMLSPLYNVFFDIERPSLPMAEPFLPHIINAARNSRLAVVVLSNTFFRSKWPMLELFEFVDAGVQILPLFYELSPRDLKDKEKLQEWHKKWEELASKDDRIGKFKWDNARHKLCSINGLVFNKSDGELAYLEEIVTTIYQVAPPLIRSSHDAVEGRDRLCKVIIDKFEELEQKSQNSSGVYLLGVYGLPGSGKSTLCACLRDHFFSSFAGRSLHLKLPTDPTPAELLRVAKQLLKLTNFGHNRETMISEIEDLSQMGSILQASNLQSLRVFLVIDNISSRLSIKVVEDILRLGVGAGSQVMLVARTLEILSPLLNFQTPPSHIHYICGSLTVPRINETEAICLLMQSAGALGLASSHSQKMEEYSPGRRRILAKVARMCAFPEPSHQDLLYLPLALKIIGSLLSSEGVDLGEQFSKLEAKITGFKEVAVREIVEESYEKLPEELKLLFLDVALFMVPYYQSWEGDFESNKEEGNLAAELLGFMHECSPEIIKIELNELMRLCFLLEWGFEFDTVFDIHDVFLEFAKSVRMASSEYYCRRRSMSGSEVMSDLLSITANSSLVGLRALILELDEDCKKFDFPEGLRVKVVVVRHCKSLEVLGLRGLTYLLSLEIEGCPKLRHLDFGSGVECTLKRVRWGKKEYERMGAADCRQKEGSSQKSLLQMLAGRGMQAWCLMSSALGGGYGRPPSNSFGTLACQLKALQVLRLDHTGIRNLGECSSCWPQLRVLHIFESHLEELELGYLPNLKEFFFGDRDRLRDHAREKCFMRSHPGMLRKAKLLAGCPELEDVHISDPSFEDGMGTLILPPNSRSLSLINIFHGEPVLPDFTSSAHLLENITVHGHWVLQSIGFTCELLCLERIDLRFCPNLVTITGLEWLPNLRKLSIWYCAKLQSLGNLEALRMLEDIEISLCPVLTASSLGALSSQHLATLVVWGCPNVRISVSDLENLTALSKLWCTYVLGNRFNLKNLVNLEELTLDWKCEGQANMNPVSLMGSCEQVDGNYGAQVVQSVPLFVVGEVAPAYLSRLALDGVQNLVSLDGIHHCCGTLSYLSLGYLPKLTCLQGLQFLVNLEDLRIKHCPASQ